MSLPKKFDDRLKTALGMRAVWEPGSSMDLGDVLQRENGIFRPIADLKKDFGIKYRRESLSREKSLAFQARGVSTKVLQAGAEVALDKLDVKAQAELEIKFGGQDGYLIRTPMLTGVGIDNLFSVGKQLRKNPDWNRGKFYIAWRVYSAREFLFLGNQSRNRSIKLGGLGSAILEFLTFGLSGKVSRISSSDLTVEIIGKGGPVAMGVARVKNDRGEIAFD